MITEIISIFEYIIEQYDKIALITGITGQDGSYLAEFLLSKGYIVHGIKKKEVHHSIQKE